MKITNPFLEGDSTWSWRKTGTAICYSVFGFACIGNQIASNFEELPSTYIGVLAGVFVFYFGKGMLDGIKVMSKPVKTNEV